MEEKKANEVTTASYWVRFRATSTCTEGLEYGACNFLLSRYPNVHLSLHPCLCSHCVKTYRSQFLNRATRFNQPTTVVQKHLCTIRNTSSRANAPAEYDTQSSHLTTRMKPIRATPTSSQRSDTHTASIAQPADQMPHIHPS